MIIYGPFKWTDGMIGSQKIFEINDAEGNSWYDLMEELDKRDSGVVCGVAPEGYISWETSGKVAGIHAPSDGFKVVVVDSLPDDIDYRDLRLSENGFIPKVVEAETWRTKEDILADLIKLQEELKAL